MNLFNGAGANPVTYRDVTGLAREDWSNVKADPERAAGLFGIIKAGIPGYGTNKEVTAMWDSILNNVRFGDASSKGLRGEHFKDIIILENDDCNQTDQAVELFHELLHRANHKKLFKIVPQSLYSPGVVRYNSLASDAQIHARNHAWIYIQMARFAQKNCQSSFGDFMYDDLYDYDWLMNPGGKLDTDPAYLDQFINRFHRDYDFYGL